MKQPRSLVEKAFMLELERGLAAPKKSFDELVYTVDLEQYRLPYSRYGWTRKFWIALGSATAGTALTVTVVISVYFGLGLFHGNGGSGERGYDRYRHRDNSRRFGRQYHGHRDFKLRIFEHLFRLFQIIISKKERQIVRFVIFFSSLALTLPKRKLP